MPEPVRFRIEPTTVGDGRLLRFLTEQQPPQPSWEAPPTRPLPPQQLLEQQQQDQEQQERALSADGDSAGAAAAADGSSEAAAPALAASARTAAAAAAAAASAVASGKDKGERQQLRSWLAAAAAIDLVGPPLDLLQQSGAFLMAVDELQQQQQQQQNLLLRNEAVWAAAIARRDKAAQKLAAGSMTADMLLGTLHAAPGERFLTLLPAVDQPREQQQQQQQLQEQQQQLLIGLQQRHERAEKLQAALASCIRELKGPHGAPASAQWLQLLQLLHLQQWETVKKQYHALEFEVVDGNYPYRSEVYVHLMHVASTCWGPTPDARTALPLPPPPPFQEHFALLSVAEPPEDADHRQQQQQQQQQQIRLQLEFPSPVGPLIEGHSSLHCRAALLMPFPELQHRRLQQQHNCCCCCSQRGAAAAAACGAFRAEREAREAAAAAETATTSNLHGSTCLPELSELRMPLADESSSSSDNREVAAAAAEVHQHLEGAQWVLADLAAAHVLSAQLLQQQQEGSLTVARRHRSSSSSSSSWCGTTCGSSCLSVETLRVSSDRVELLIRNVPVYSHQQQQHEEQQQQEPAGCHTHDFTITISYVPSVSPDSDSSATERNSNDTSSSSNGINSSSSSSTGCCGCSRLLLQQFERVAVLSLRQLFLDTWAAEAFAAPAASADGIPKSPAVRLLQQQLKRKLRLPPAEQQQPQQLSGLRGTCLLQNFLRWLLEAMELLLLPPQ
ncbi:hypothetical protein, conserved [Eimeria necatrix]|uniref:Uncharacterized protein n=1 Tax=Eimeria necatrix TaxID=51315 RepID=U6MK17_9EIME|nr:hypothetical protein, conserved [Eimeria necatrix]CDJ62000.1 hypothetical protein, conserved [Eimeria necatrix]